MTIAIITAHWTRPRPLRRNVLTRAAPAMPPILKRAWKLDMIGRPAACWTAIAWAFIATSRAPSAAPKANRVIASSSGVIGTARNGSAAQVPSAAIRTTRRLPQR